MKAQATAFCSDPKHSARGRDRQGLPQPSVFEVTDCWVSPLQVTPAFRIIPCRVGFAVVTSAGTEYRLR